MRICEMDGYSGTCPENFNWSLCDSHKLEKLAQDLAKQIKIELAQPPGNRVNVPGLRFALARIAGTDQ